MIKTRAALIGCGKRTINVYIPILQKIKNIVCCAGVYNRSEKPAKEAGEILGVPAFTDIEELCKKTEFEIAIICVNRAAHLVPSLACIKAGKHLLIETPIAESLEDAQKIIEAARKAGVTLEIAENVPRNPDMMFLRKCIAERYFLNNHPEIIVNPVNLIRITGNLPDFMIKGF